MANKEQDYKPQAKPADEATKPCQEFIRLYPTRLTLTDKAFEKIKTEGTAPVMPKGIPTAGDDYELRRLRSGYIYILAENAESDCFSITGEAALFQGAAGRDVNLLDAPLQNVAFRDNVNR